MKRKHGFVGAVALLCLSWLAPAMADTPGPYEVVRKATDQVLAVSIAAKKYVDQDPERYYTAVEDALDPAVDFDGFARGVMATYASARDYNALKTDAERQAFRDRVHRFSIKLKRVLLVTYAKALLAFNGERIELEKPSPADVSQGWVTINQNIYSNSGKVYVVQYTLRKNRTGEWKVRNVIVDGVNLGQVYRTQFADAVEKNQGDIDKTIDNWGKDLNPGVSAGTAGG